MYNLKKFRIFCNVKSYDELLEIPPAKINLLIEDWIMDLKEKFSPNSIPTMYYGIELFFSMNDVTLNVKKLRRIFPAKVKRGGDKPYTTDDIQKMISNARYTRDKAFMLFLASTGARVGAIDGLKLRHVEEMHNGCKSVLMYEKSEEEYYGFLTPEASAVLDEYFAERRDDGEKMTPESPVFRTTWSKGIINPKSLTVAGAKNIIYRALEHARIKREKTGNVYDIQLDMGFRKRFNTILKLNNDVNFNIAEKLMAHKRGLDGAYLKPTRDQCFYEFSKAIPELIISHDKRQKMKIDQQQKEISELQSQQNEIDDLKNKVRRIELRGSIAESIKQGMIEWSEKHPDRISPLSMAKADFTKPNLDKIVEHYLKEHDGNIDGLREAFANHARVTVHDD
jgi:integrase